jgi:type III secretory pathway component EscT
LLGFLGITADITGFTFDAPILMVCLLLSSFIQLLKNTADEDNRRERSRKRN